MSQETEAVVVVVSEETGNISIACRGRLQRGLTAAELREALAIELAVSVAPLEDEDEDEDIRRAQPPPAGLSEPVPTDAADSEPSTADGVDGVPTPKALDDSPGTAEPKARKEASPDGAGQAA
jgi:hypothetical protein